MTRKQRSAKGSAPKPPRRKAAGRGARRMGRGRSGQPARVALGLLLLVALVCGGALALHTWLQGREGATPPRREPARAAGTAPARPAAKPLPALKVPAPPPPMPLKAPPPEPAKARSAPAAPVLARKAPPTYEVFPPSDLPPRRPVPPSARPRSDDLPRVAIIIDDIGYDGAMAEKFLALELSLTLSLFPHGPFSARIQEAAQRHGAEIMLHLPMEPEEYPQVDPGEGALLAAMEREELARRIEALLDALPAARGVNNHMGSRLTAQSGAMEQLFGALQRRGLFFVDSRTSARSAARNAALGSGVPFAERDVFLDHQQDPQFVRRQVDKLIETARRQGEAIGIAHPHEVTYRVLRELAPLLREKTRLVPASQLVRPAG